MGDKEDARFNVTRETPAGDYKLQAGRAVPALRHSVSMRQCPAKALDVDCSNHFLQLVAPIIQSPLSDGPTNKQPTTSAQQKHNRWDGFPRFYDLQARQLTFTAKMQSGISGTLSPRTMPLPPSTLSLIKRLPLQPRRSSPPSSTTCWPPTPTSASSPPSRRRPSSPSSS